jgi:hypothetical protein
LNRDADRYSALRHYTGGLPNCGRQQGDVEGSFGCTLYIEDLFPNMSCGDYQATEGHWDSDLYPISERRGGGYEWQDSYSPGSPYHACDLRCLRLYEGDDPDRHWRECRCSKKCWCWEKAEERRLAASLGR